MTPPFARVLLPNLSATAGGTTRRFPARTEYCRKHSAANRALPSIGARFESVGSPSSRRYVPQATDSTSSRVILEGARRREAQKAQSQSREQNVVNVLSQTDGRRPPRCRLRRARTHGPHRRHSDAGKRHRLNVVAPAFAYRCCEVIVRPVHDRVQLIAQPDHAHLARTIMEHCVTLADRPRRNLILHAIAEHDNGWAEVDAAPTVDPDTGTVADFVSAPIGVRHAVWPRGVARLADDPWAAALVAQHALTVYDRFRPEAEWTPFFAGMEAARDAMLRASNLPLDDLVADYVFVRLGDLISLTFCTGSTDVQRFGDWTVQLSGTRVVVAPDAFGGVRIPIATGARTIRNQLFRSDAQLRDALREANMVTLRGEVAGAPNETAPR
ncbi:MAG: DUF3891 family protein [Luteitalea sp.]|nr:DUF3891 family protein [Luteitalea sp.]